MCVMQWEARRKFAIFELRYLWSLLPKATKNMAHEHAKNVLADCSLTKKIQVGDSGATYRHNGSEIHALCTVRFQQPGLDLSAVVHWSHPLIHQHLL